MKYLWCLWWLLVVVPAWAQHRDTALTDSLTGMLSTTPGDTAKAALLHRLVAQRRSSDPAAALEYARAGLALAQRLGWKKEIAQFCGDQGSVLSQQGDYTTAAARYRQAYAIKRQLNDAPGMLAILISMATNEHRQSHFAQALQNYFQALPLARTLHDTAREAMVLNSVAGIFLVQGDAGKGIGYGRRALALCAASRDDAGRASALLTLGNLYSSNHNGDSADIFYAGALAIYRKQRDTIQMAIVYGALGANSKAYPQKIAYERQAKTLWDSRNPDHPNAITNTGNLGADLLNLYFADTARSRGRSPASADSAVQLLQQSETYLREAIARAASRGDRSTAAYFMGALAELEFEKKNYREAYLRLRDFHSVTDSIFSQQNKNQVAAIESREAIALRDEQLQLNRLELTAQRQHHWLLVGGMVALFCVAVALFVLGQRRKRRANALRLLNHQLDQANKRNALFFAILSHDLRAPVSSLIGFLEMEREREDTLNAEMLHAHRGQLIQRARGVLDTMESLLLWSKGQMDQFRPVSERVSVAELFDWLRRPFQYPGVALVLGDPGQLVIQTDPNYCRTILHNLTANAAKTLLQQGNGLVRWEACREPHAVLLSITDNGPGMPDQAIRTLQSEEPTPNTHTGFGLHLVRDLAKAIGCGIRVTTSPAQGTTLTLIFPDPMMDNRSTLAPRS